MMADDECPPEGFQQNPDGHLPPLVPLPPTEATTPDKPDRATECEITDRLDILTRMFESKLAYDEFKETQISRLHAELQENKSELLFRRSMPLVNGIIRVHDSMGKLIDSSSGEDSSLSVERLIRTIKAFREDLEEILSDHGVNSFQMPDGPFDPHRQRALRTIPTQSPELTGRIAERLYPGFERENGVVIKERVAVYVTAPAQTCEPVNSETTSKPSPLQA